MIGFTSRISLAILLAFPCLINAQSAAIAPLFGLELNASDSIDFQSINLTSGETYFLETLPELSLIGQNYAVNYLSKEIYFLNNNQSLLTYSFPSVFFGTFNNVESVSNTPFALDEITFSNSSNSLFAVDGSSVLYELSTDGFILNEYTFNNFVPLLGQTSIASTNTIILLSSPISNSGMQLTAFDTDNSSFTVLPTINGLEELNLISHEFYQDIIGVAKDSSGAYSVLSFGGITVQNTVRNLPACTNCFYDKNALAIDYENNLLITVKGEIINADTTYFLATYGLEDTLIAEEVEISSRISNLIFDKAAADLVFPGDADHNKLVDMTDIFPIGVNYNQSTFQRQETTTEWIGQFAFNVGDTLANGVDVKHADCNGDGQINSIDADAILQNFNYVHNSEKGSADDECPYQLHLETPDSLIENGIAETYIRLGSSTNTVSDVYGISFTLEYNPTFFQENSIELQGLDSWLGNLNTDYFKVDLNEFNQGKLHVGLVGIDFENKSGGGDIIKGIWGIEGEVIPEYQSMDIEFKLTNVTIINYDETRYDACGSTKTVTVFDQSVGIKDYISQYVRVFPIPAAEYLNLEIDGSFTLNKYEIVNHLGAVVASEKIDNPSKHLVVSTKNLAKGVYLLKLTGTEGITTKKIVLE